MVAGVTRRAKPVVRWRQQDGTAWELPLRELTTDERMLLFTEGPHGLEPLWLWLSERGMPFAVHSWEGVFREANQRCERTLAPPGRAGLDPHQVLAPYATPHSARHSFADYMLIVLNTLTDLRYGLNAEERRDFAQLYGDPWFMVQQLLGHASRQTTVESYLAPVADLNLRSMLAGADGRPPPRCPSWTRSSPGWHGSRGASRTADDIGRALSGAAWSAGRGTRPRCLRRPRPARAPGRGDGAPWSCGAITAKAVSGGPNSRSCTAPGRCSTRWRPCSGPVHATGHGSVPSSTLT